MAMWEVSFRVEVDDALDGALRLLGDSQRFGLRLGSFAVISHGTAGASVTLQLSAEDRPDVALLAGRFARHPTVRQIAAI